MDWTKIGSTEPYFGVITHAEYLRGNMTDDARAEFFRTGEAHLSRVVAKIKTLYPDFAPVTALDFGCGVGRVLAPLSKMCKATGVDVSPGMLAEARKNTNGVTLSHDVEGCFDFIHSSMVFQHIPERTGVALFRKLAHSLNPGGVAALHITYWREGSAFVRFAHWLKTKAPAINYLINLIHGKPLDFPRMIMVCYNLSELMNMLRLEGITDVHVEIITPRRVEPAKGVILYFRK